ncbi:hypothetical protein QQF64_029431 [Cirrhinus molitorella]|uniref:Uncharacterized protein n=1 Tax=Cirrhinus molitorella TaxID=172907 RepID=A0ABR3N0T3_9TELE
MIQRVPRFISRALSDGTRLKDLGCDPRPERVPAESLLRQMERPAGIFQKSAAFPSASSRARFITTLSFIHREHFSVWLQKRRGRLPFWISDRLYIAVISSRSVRECLRRREGFGRVSQSI